MEIKHQIHWNIQINYGAFFFFQGWTIKKEDAPVYQKFMKEKD